MVTYRFSWIGLIPADLIRANKSREEDEIVVCVPFTVSKDGADSFFIIEVHHEKYVGEPARFDLEVYHSNDSEEYLEWMFSIKEIKTATNYRRFCKRAEDLIVQKLYRQE